MTSQSKIKIRPIKYYDVKQVKGFFAEVDVSVNMFYSLETSLQLRHFPFNGIHAFFPVHWRFLTDCFVALEDKNLVGLIGLNPDSKSHLRWKINQLLLKSNSYDAGKLLIDYIINKYGALGIESFLTEVDSLNTDAINLFKNGCGFRECTINHIMQHCLNGNNAQNVEITNFREVNPQDDHALQDLYKECITPQTKTSLDKDAPDFHFGLINNIKESIIGTKSKRWILEHPDNKSALAYASVVTRDNKVFQIFIIASLPYASYYSDILNYVIRYVYYKNKEATLLINVYESIQSHKKFLEVLKEQDITSEHTCHVLVKDYWRPIKERKILSSPVIIFPDGTSPACNSNFNIPN